MADGEISKAVDDFFREQQYFNGVRRFPQMRLLGEGAQGYAFLVHEIDEDLQPVRKLVVKYAKLMAWDADTQKEKRWLEMLRYAQHIVQPIDIDQTGFRRQLLVTEYLEHGSMADLIQRVQVRSWRIPNLILWRIFLCLTRAAVAMAYPPLAPLQRETIPASTAPLTLAHSDLHVGNVLIGAVSPNDSEHSITPIVKLIDFGVATQLRPSRTLGNRAGIAMNIYDIAAVMFSLLVAFTGNRGDPTSFMSDDQLDPDLKDLISTCMSPYETSRPQLHDVLARCEGAVANRSASDFSGNGDGGLSERPESLKRFVKAVLLDADDTQGLITVSNMVRRATLVSGVPQPRSTSAVNS